MRDDSFGCQRIAEDRKDICKKQPLKLAVRKEQILKAGSLTGIG